jgi:hypothetical protein
MIALALAALTAGAAGGTIACRLLTRRANSSSRGPVTSLSAKLTVSLLPDEDGGELTPAAVLTISLLPDLPRS